MNLRDDLVKKSTLAEDPSLGFSIALVDVCLCESSAKGLMTLALWAHTHKCTVPPFIALHN